MLTAAFEPTGFICVHTVTDNLLGKLRVGAFRPICRELLSEVGENGLKPTRSQLVEHLAVQLVQLFRRISIMQGAEVGIRIIPDGFG